MNKIETYKTINILVAVFLSLFIISGKYVLLCLALALLLNNIFIFKLNELISKYWLKFSKLLGEINSRILLTAVFYLFLTPLAYVYRVFNSNETAKFVENRKGSFFDNIDTAYSKDSFEKQW